MLQFASSLDSTGFDLLNLQEDEYLFRNIPCSFIQYPRNDEEATDADVQSPLSAHLKLCSHSLYLVPIDATHPILRFPHEDIIDFIEGDSSIQPTFTINSRIRILIHQIDPPKPYQFINDQPCKVAISFDESGVAFHVAPLQLLRQLWKIYQETIQDSSNNKELTRNKQIQDIIDTYQGATRCEVSLFDSDNSSSKPQLQTRAGRISPLVIQRGWIAVTSTHLYFQPYEACYTATAAPQYSYSLESIVGLSRRKHRLLDCALEVFFSSPTKPSLLLALRDSEECNQIQSLLTTSAPNIKKPLTLAVLTKQWQARRLSSYSYLLHLNDLAGRSFNDFTQYPIFPWVLSDYSSPTLDLDDPKIYRDLSLPIAALNATRRQNGHELYLALQGSKSDGESNQPAWMYGSHYSNPGIVVHYIVRALPRGMLRLQAGRYDAPDRLFSSIPGAWESAMRWPSDVKELTPDFYNLQKAEGMLFNKRRVDFGQRGDSSFHGRKIDDVELPAWANGSVEEFVRIMKEALESEYVSEKLPKWIDLVFGINSRGKGAVRKSNVFHYMTDDDLALQCLQRESDPVLKKAYEAQIQEYGRTPMQLFFNKHPKRRGYGRLDKLVQSCTCGGAGPSVRVDVAKRNIKGIYVEEGKIAAANGSREVHNGNAVRDEEQLDQEIVEAHAS